MGKLCIVIVLLGLSLALVCGQPTKGHHVSETARRLATSLNHFSFQLHDVLRSKDNVFYSPFSIANALGMVHLGARSETQQELARALGYKLAGLGDDQVAQAFDEVLTLFEAVKNNYALEIGNRALVGEKLSFPVLEYYKEAIQKYYHAEIERVNFREHGDEILEKINNWVNEKTHGKIEKLLDEPLDEFTALVLLNAVYFKGTWKTQFKSEHTETKDFYNYDGSVSQVPLMSLNARFNNTYSKELNSRILELPYDGDDLNMYVVLPEDAKLGLDDLEKRVTASNLENALEHLYETEVDLEFPKFKLESTYDQLNDVLRKVGIKKVFNGESDLSGITGHYDLFVSKTVHKAVIEVNEEGSEAAAVTGVVLESRMGSFSEEFIINRPFLFFIRDSRTGLILFIGSVKHL